MGLVFSVLVACVGLCELFAFYSKVRRNLIFPSPRGDLTSISDSYIKELRGLRKDIATNSQKTSDGVDNVSTNIPSLRLNSLEDIKIEYLNSKSSSPSKSQTSIPDISIKGEQNHAESPNKPRFVLQERQGIAETPTLHPPTPSAVTENELNTILLKDAYFETTAQRERSLSPCPPLDLPQVPRNSVCSELSSISEVCIDERKSRSPTPSGRVDVILENTSFNTTQYWTNKVLVVPSRKSRSRSPSPNAQKSIDSERRDYPFLEAPKHTRERSKSESNDHIVDTPLNSASKAASNLSLSDEFEWSFPLQLEEEASSFEDVNSGKSALRSGREAKTERRYTTESEKTNSKIQDLFKSERTIAVSTKAAEDLREVSSKDKSSSSGTKEPSESKHGEPFWVKNRD